MVLVLRGGGEHAVPCMENQKCRHGAVPRGKSPIDKVWSKDRLLKKGKYFWSRINQERTSGQGVARKGIKVKDPPLLHSEGAEEKVRFCVLDKTLLTLEESR